MTGGIGFSRQASQSFQDNQNLKKTRQKIATNPPKRPADEVNLEAIQESITFQNKKSEANRIQSLIGFILILILLLSIVLLVFWG
jgi:ABC-type Fe2+-enterobactin transport system substrate-binding protein